LTNPVRSRSKWYALWYLCIGAGFFLLGMRALLLGGWIWGVVLRWIIAAGFIVLSILEFRGQKPRQ